MSVEVSINPIMDSAGNQPAIRQTVNPIRTETKRYPSTSYSSNSIIWSIVPPSRGSFMSRVIRRVIPIKVTYAGTASAALLQSGYDALRSLASHRIIQNEAISINGSSIPSTNANTLYPEIALHYNRDMRVLDPLGYVDTYQNYVDGVGSANNPLSGYQDCDQSDGLTKRGALKFVSWTNTTTASVLQCELESYVYYSGLFGPDQQDKLGLIRIDNIEINDQLDLSNKNVVSHAPSTSTISSITVELNGIPYLMCRFTTPIQSMIPTGPLIYPCLKLWNYNMTGANLASNASMSITNNSVQLTSVPRFVWLYVQEQQGTKTYLSSDTFARIDQLQISFNGQSSLLAECDNGQLYQISKENGLLDPEVAFAGISRTTLFATAGKIGTVGSLICLAFGKDIPLGDPNLQVGQMGSFQFNVQCTFTNVNQTTAIANPTLITCIGYDSNLTIDDGGLVNYSQATGIQIENIGSAENVEVVPFSNSLDSAYGAGPREIFRGINKFLKKSKLISTLSKNSPSISATASTLGYGGKMMASGAGYTAMGGKEMGVSDLKKMIKSL